MTYWIAWAVLTVLNTVMFVVSLRWLSEIQRLGDEIRAEWRARDGAA